MTDFTASASSPRIVLGIEAATPAGGVALAQLDSTGGMLLRAHSWRERGGALSPFLLADVDRLLREESLAPDSIAAIAVTLGPGGFTGLRVGLALAKTLADQVGCRLYGFSTLEALAARCLLPGVTVVPLLDARRQEVYWGAYRMDDAGQPAPLHDDALNRPEVAAQWLAEQPGPLLLTGSGARQYRAVFEAARPSGSVWQWAPAGWGNPGADSVALLGAAALAAGRDGIDPLAAEPSYLRDSDAARRHPHGVIGAGPRGLRAPAAGGPA